MSRIPDVENAYVEAKKILDYLLDLSHEEGGPKARFFMARGFSRASRQGFAEALVAHAQTRDFTEAERPTSG